MTTSGSLFSLQVAKKYGNMVISFTIFSLSIRALTDLILLQKFVYWIKSHNATKSVAFVGKACWKVEWPKRNIKQDIFPFSLLSKGNGRILKEVTKMLLLKMLLLKIIWNHSESQTMFFFFCRTELEWQMKSKIWREYRAKRRMIMMMDTQKNNRTLWKKKKWGQPFDVDVYI